MSAGTFRKVRKQSKRIEDEREKEKGETAEAVNRQGTPISFPTLTALPSGWQLSLMKAACKLTQETTVRVLNFSPAYENGAINDKVPAVKFAEMFR